MLMKEGGNGSRQTILLARRTRTMKLCSSDARSEGQSGCSLLKRNEQAWRDHFIEENCLVDGRIGRKQHGLS